MTSKIFVPIALLGAFTSGGAYAAQAEPETQPHLGAQVESELAVDVAAEASEAALVENENAESVVTDDAPAETKRARVNTDMSRPASLVEFDGVAAVLKKAGRRRVVLESLGYKLTVGIDGKPTSCEVTDDYRQKFTAISLCNTLIGHHSFEPARDADGNAIEGSYENRLYYANLRKELER